MHKYGARRTEVDGITFASAAEARRYSELKLLERAGEIFDLALQPRFTLQPAFKHGGKHYRAIDYVGDFSYREKDSPQLIVEDVKGFPTPVFRLKEKLFLFHYPDIELRITP